MKLGGALAHRDNQPLGDYCPIERALALLTPQSSLLVLREAFYGATRFDEFAARTALTDATTSARLRELVGAGLLETRTYQEPGQRRRAEYVLTSAGADLMPAIFALLQWGNAHTPPPYPPSLEHHGCGEPVTITARCAAGHDVGSDDIQVTAPGPF
jgi:DNA-binding HxlR family transcriptional regulator